MQSNQISLPMRCHLKPFYLSSKGDYLQMAKRVRRQKFNRKGA